MLKEQNYIILRDRTGKRARIADRDRGDEADQYELAEIVEAEEAVVEPAPAEAAESSSSRSQHPAESRKNKMLRKNLSHLLQKQKRQKMKQNHKPQTLFDKIWSSHLVDQQEDGTCLIYIDRHLVHEVTSPSGI